MWIYSIFVIFSILLLGSVTTSQLVFADGSDSPAGCIGGPTDNTGGSTLLDAGAGNIIPSICIKSGDNSFGSLKHSGVLNIDGTYGDGDAPNTCYTVSGLGTQTVNIIQTGSAGCKDVSHVDYFIESNGVPPSETPVGGQMIPIDTAALLLAGAQSSLVWIMPVILAGAGFAAFKLRRS